MPTLDELGHRIAQPFQQTASLALLAAAARAALEEGRMPGGSLEAWLSNLATPAPFFNAAERFHNAAIAQELVTLLVDEIERSESATLSKPMPYWLGRLVALWDRLAATVITFNYDTLVEQGVNASGMPWILSPAGDDAIQGVAVPLNKMHGSTNWWWIPSDRLGTTVRPGPLAGRWGAPQPSRPIEGMERFVVPPLAVKSDYYEVNFTRNAWTLARQALQAASRVILMGYSAPVTDLTLTSLLSNYADPHVPCVVVNTSPDEVVERFQKLGLHRATAFGGEEPIRRFVEQYEQSTSRTVAGSLLPLFEGMDISQDDPVVARIAEVGGEPRLPITSIRTEDDVAFVATQWQSGDVIADMAIKVGQAHEAIAEAARSGRPLMLEVPGQPHRAVLHIARRVMNRNFLAIEA